MIGSIIGGALSVGGQIFGGITASKAMKKYRRSLREQQRKNTDWYNRRYNEDATQRADARRILAATDERIRQRNRAAAGAQAVVGGTTEASQATQAANNEAAAEAASQIAAAGERRKDGIEQQYRETDSRLQGALDGMEAGRVTAIGQAVQGVADAGARFATEYDDANAKLKEYEDDSNKGVVYGRV